MAIYILAQEIAPAPQLTPAQQHSVIFWCVVMILITLAGFGIIVYIKRRMNAHAQQAKYDTGFSLSDLRDMRDRGEITPEEYEQTRARVIAKVKGRARQDDREKREAADAKKGTSAPADDASVPDSGDAGTPGDTPDSGDADPSTPH